MRQEKSFWNSGAGEIEVVYINKKFAISALGFIFVASIGLLAGEAYAAERALWVWGMADDIVLNAPAKQEFFDFCAAPHGDAAKAITLVFFDAKPYGVNLMDAANAPALRQFLSDAHDRGIKVEFLSGDKEWATPENRAEGESLIDEIASFNLGGAATQRFDGIQYDVEPYLLKAKENSDPQDWEYDKALVWSEYLSLLTNCQTRVNAYNAVNTPDIRFGAAIPFWYVLDATPGPQQVIDRVNYVAVMAYRDVAATIINAAQDEINYAASAGKKVYVAIETSHPTDTIEFPPSTTFYEEGNTAMEAELAQVHSAFSGSSGYAGIALHYYEDLAGVSGKEISYRSLWTSSNPYRGHYPVVGVVSPNKAEEVWAGSVNIQWEATDLDGNSMTVKIEYSSNGGGNWTTIIASTANTGRYLWNTAGLPTGSNYLIRVAATDNSANALSGHDVSNKAFAVSSVTAQTNIANLHLWNEGSTSLRLKWTPPIYTPRAYRIYRSVNGGIFTEISGSPFVTVNKYIDTGLNGTNKYKYQIKAIYGDGSEGNISNSSNMLIPDGTFLLDYCEENEGITYSGPYGTSALTPSFDTVEKYEGAKSRKLIYAYAGSGWGAILLGAVPVKVDVSPYSTVSIWVKGGVVGQPAFAVKLIETGRPEGSEEWRSPNITISNANWTEYKLNFSDFTLDSAAGNNRLDEHSIGSYGLLFTSTTANGTYYVDAMQFVSTGATISVPPGPGPNGEYSFGTVNGTISDHRFKLGPIPVTFSGFASPWTIRIWTNNGGGAGKAGLVGVTDTNQALRLKVWCANFGPTAAVPDEEDNAYWVNNQTGWFRIPEYSEMNPADVYTWRRLAWANSAQDASLGNPFDIYLAIDVLDAAVIQQYQTTSLTVEYINE